jgi:hypothetical protein
MGETNWKIEDGWNGAERVPFLTHDERDGIRLDEEAATFLSELGVPTLREDIIPATCAKPAALSDTQVQDSAEKREQALALRLGTQNAEFLNWVADRLVHHYHEDENVDFVLKLRRLADELWSSTPR